MDEQEVKALLKARAKRLMEKNEPELAGIVRLYVGRSMAEGIEALVRGWTGRRDTGRLAYWLALAYADEVPPIAE